jgi:hypothetical protein
MIESRELVGKVIRRCDIDKEGKDGPEIHIEFTDEMVFSVRLETDVSIDQSCACLHTIAGCQRSKRPKHLSAKRIALKALPVGERSFLLAAALFEIVTRLYDRAKILAVVISKFAMNRCQVTRNVLFSTAPMRLRSTSAW